MPPQEMRDLAIATLPANVQAIIVIGLAAITKFQATVQPWTEEPAGQFFVPESGRELKAEGKREGDVMVFTLEPTGDAGDQILAVSFRFDVGDSYPGGGTYLWRLNPASDATPMATADQTATATFSQSDVAQAREALVDYFSLLHARRYAEAANYYGGSYDILRDWNPTVDPNDYAALFENGCTINGLMCLEVRTIAQEETASSNEFKLVVEFTSDNGSLFVRGPCCGATETDMPPQSQFPYKVRKVDGRFLVQDLPVYVP